MAKTNNEAKKETLNKAVDALITTADSSDALFKEEMNGFKKLFHTFVDRASFVIDWNKIKPPPQGMIVDANQLEAVPEDKRGALLNKLCVIKLNGGLGTTMGCTGPKSVIEVRGDLTFLDLTVQQIENLNKKYHSNVPLILMNSFNTHEDTQNIIEKYKSHSHIHIHTFNQSRYPRIFKETLTPVPGNSKGKLSDWYPPGHGDVYEAFKNSGLLDQMVKEGKEYVFISNVDNLGATVDLDILYHIEKTNAEYVMEVTDKTRADVKGGTLIDYEGKATLLEIAQVPSAYVEEFKSIKKFKIFNTNNLWVNLKAVQRVVKEDLMKDMDIIVNHKVVDGKAVIQLERAAGSAIQYFNGGIGINVPRSRFLPVKSCSDLFIVQSNLYSLEDGSLIMNPKRAFTSVPLVKLGDEFKKVSDFLRRFQNTPDLLELDHLTVSGDVTFGADVVLKGTVIIVANHGSRIDIPSGSNLENKVITGHLRILDH